MIDYVKIQLPNEVGARLLQHPLLSFIGKFDYATGAVIGGPCKAEFGPRIAIGRTVEVENDRRALQFVVYPSGRTILHGSFHKFAQDGTNWNDYTFTQFRETVNELCNTFNIDPRAMHLLQFEAGVNIKPPIRTPRALQAIICHREGHAFTPMRSTKGRSLGIVMEREEYAIKVYDKGRQYGLPGDLLRFELKYRKSAAFNRENIYTLHDLLDPKSWQRLETRILTLYGELFIAEPSIDLGNLTNKQRMFVHLARTPLCWQELTKGKRYKARERYSKIVERFAGSDLKAALAQTIKGKLGYLLNIPLQDELRGDEFTNIGRGDQLGKERPFHGSIKVGNGYSYQLNNGLPELRDNHELTVPDNYGVPTVFVPLELSGNKVASPLNKRGKTRCLTCGRDITGQRTGSKYCSEAIYGKAAKRCRNAGSNPRNNRLRSLQRIERTPLLFDHLPYIRPLSDHRYPTSTPSH